MRKIWTATWRMVLLFVAWAVLPAPLFLPFVLNRTLAGPVAGLCVEGTFAATLLAAVWIIQDGIDHRPLVSLGFAREHASRDVGVGLGLVVSGRSLSSGWPMVEVRGPPLITGGGFGIEGGLVALLVTTIAAAITASRMAGDDSPAQT